MSIRNIIILSIFALVLTALPQSGAAQEFKLHDGDSIVFLGDSITQAGKQPEGYTTLFKVFCDINGFEVDVINAGIGGHKSNDMLARLQKDVLSHNPTWVSISCGVNDVWHSFKEKPTGVPLPQYQKNMTEIVDRCLNSGAKVILLTSTPIYEKIDSAQNQKLKPYNVFLRQLAKDKKIILCDLSKIFLNLYGKKLRDDRLLTLDGVHMNPRGNRIMAAEIIKSLGGAKHLRLAKKRWELINNM